MPTLFERIIYRDIPADVVYEDDLAIAIRDINPQAPVHLLVIPKKPISSLEGIGEGDALLVAHLFTVVRRVAAQEGLAAKGYRVVINCGADAMQTVPHLHLHVLGGKPLSWHPG